MGTTARSGWIQTSPFIHLLAPILAFSPTLRASVIPAMRLTQMFSPSTSTSSVGSSTNVTFLAKAKSSDKNLVVNLVHQYGVEAHQLLADAGAAPWLLYCGSLDGKHDVGANGSRFKGSTKLCGLYSGPISMAVMEYIEGKTMDKITSLPNDTHERIQKAVSKLYGADLIFGDLRKPNIIVSDQKAFLIDFDWAGKESEEAYRRM